MLYIDIIVVYSNGLAQYIRSDNGLIRHFHSHEAVNAYIHRSGLDHRKRVMAIVEISYGSNQGGKDYEY